MRLHMGLLVHACLASMLGWGNRSAPKEKPQKKQVPLYRRVVNDRRYHRISLIALAPWAVVLGVISEYLRRGASKRGTPAATPHPHRLATGGLRSFAPWGRDFRRSPTDVGRCSRTSFTTVPKPPQIFGMEIPTATIPGAADGARNGQILP